MKAIGITATDTEFGKTVVSSCLAAGFKYLGFDMSVFKPAPPAACVRQKAGLFRKMRNCLLKVRGLQWLSTTRLCLMFWKRHWHRRKL